MKSCKLESRLSWLVLVLLICLPGGAAEVFLETGEEYTGNPVELGRAILTIRQADSALKRLPLSRIVGLKIENRLINGPFDYPAMASVFPGLAAVPVDSIERPERTVEGTAPVERCADCGESAPASTVEGNRPGFGQHIHPYRFALQAKPFSLMLARAFSKDAPYPARLLVARLRVVSLLGIELEPSIVFGGEGGFGFLAGPVILQTWNEYNPNPVTISLKYRYTYLETWGGESAMFLEVTRQFMVKNLIIGIGGDLGFGMNGITATETGYGSRRRTEILDVSTGVSAGFVLDIGFCL